VLNAITKKYDDILTPLKAKQAVSTTAASNLDDTRKMSQLQMVLNDVNATAADKERARLEIQSLQTGIQIRNIEQQKNVETTAAQQALDNAKVERDAILARQQAAKDLVEMHTKDNELLKQQMTLLEQLAAALAKLKGGGGISVPKPPALPANDIRSLLGNIDKPLGGLTIKDPFAGIKKSIDDLTTSVTNLGNAWKPLTDNAKPFFDWIGKDENIKNFVQFVTTFAILAGAGLLVAGAVTAAVAAISGLGIIAIIIILIAGIIAAWLTWKKQIMDWAVTTSAKIDEWVYNVGVKFTAWKNDTLKKVGDWADSTLKSIGDWAANVLKSMSDWATKAEKAITDWIANTEKDISTWASNAYNSAVSWATNIVNGLIAGLKSQWERFKSYFSGLVSDLPEWVRKLLGMGSPSKIFMDIGANMITSVAKGILDNALAPKMALGSAFGGMVNGLGSTPVSHISSTYHYNPVFNLSMQTVQQAQSVQSSFEMMRILAGG
jgi:hypothetical protein